MSIFIGGVIAFVLGIIGLIGWWSHFLSILQGIIPIMLIFAGGLAVYLSYDQFKSWWDARKAKEQSDTIDVPVKKAEDDLEALRKENEELKRKLQESAVEEKVEAAADKAKNVAAKAADKVKDAAEKAEAKIDEVAEEVKDKAKK